MFRFTKKFAWSGLRAPLVLGDVQGRRGPPYCRGSSVLGWMKMFQSFFFLIKSLQLNPFQQCLVNVFNLGFHLGKIRWNFSSGLVFWRISHTSLRPCSFWHVAW